MVAKRLPPLPEATARAQASMERFRRLVRLMADVAYYGICTLAMLAAAATILYGEWL